VDRSSPDNVTVTAARNNVQTETCYATAMSQHYPSSSPSPV